MKKAAPRNATGDRNHIGTREIPAPVSVVKNVMATPPTEEVVAKLNAIAREYPFCVLYRQNNLSIL